MKKILLVGAVALFAAVNAQQTKFGIKGGYALSNIESQELDDAFSDLDGSNKSKSGYFVGAFVEYKINDKFALQGEVQYANLGGQFEIKFNEEGFKYTLQDKINFNQIVIPLSAKYYVTPKLALYAGPSVAFSTGYKSDIKLKDTNIPSEFLQEINGSLGELEKQQDQLFEEQFKKTAFNLFLGGEFNLYKGLFVDARYSFGLTNYEENPVDNSKTTMNYLQVGLGYKF